EGPSGRWPPDELTTGPDGWSCAVPGPADPGVRRLVPTRRAAARTLNSPLWRSLALLATIERMFATDTDEESRAASPAEALTVDLAGMPLLDAFGVVRSLLGGVVDRVDVDLLRTRDAAALVPVVDGLV